MADLRIDLAAEFKGKKAFTEAGKATGGLEKAVGKLGKQIAGVFAAKKIYQFGKASIKAFAEDQKSAAMLGLAVKNLGLSFEQANVEKFIADLQRVSGVADDQLRPAFQALLTTTGDITKSQEMLKTAIDASRGSGVDLATVAQDLSNAYVGNLKGLKKYNLGLSQAQLKAMSFLEVQQKLKDQFKGASAAYLETYTGKMEALTTAVNTAQEAIGESLVNALMALTGAATTPQLVTYIENVGQRIADLITSVEKFGFLMKFWFDPKNWLKKGNAGIDAWEELLRKRAYAVAKDFDPLNNALTGYKVDEKAKADARKAAELQAKLLKQSLDNQKKITEQQKKQAALKKAGTVFDMEQIQLIAALKGKLSDEDRKRVEAQLALLNDNVDLATKLTKEILMAQDSTGNLYKYFLSIPDAKNPFGYLDKWIVDFQKQLDSLKFPMPTTVTTNAATTVVAVAPTAGVVQGFTPTTQYPTQSVMPGQSGFIGPVAPAPVINVTVQGNIIKEQELIAQIQNGTQLASLSGSPSQIGRIAGMFG